MIYPADTPAFHGAPRRHRGWMVMPHAVERFRSRVAHVRHDEATVDHLHQRIRELEADAIALRRERDDLRDAARAVVWAKVRPCYICNRVSTVTDRDDAFCEGHAHLAGVDKRDAPDAPAWRRLCALVAT